MYNIYDLNSENFLILAMKAYDRPVCLLSEFESDIKRIKYIKRLIKRFKKGGELKERLVLNHIIVLSNVFGVEFAVKSLFFKMDEIDYDVLKPFLLFLNFLPKTLNSIDGKIIRTSDIMMDMNVVNLLRKLNRESHD